MALTLLKAQRLVLGKQLCTTAAEMGLSRTTLHRIENGHRKLDEIKDDWRKAIEDYYGLPLPKLLKMFGE